MWVYDRQDMSRDEIKRGFRKWVTYKCLLAICQVDIILLTANLCPPPLIFTMHLLR